MSHGTDGKETLTMALAMTLSGPRLRRPAGQGSALKRGAGWEIGYGVCSAFQIAPTGAALVLNRRVTNQAVVDFEDGADLVVFDSLEGIRAEIAMPLMRTGEIVLPGTPETVFAVAHMSTGGFVPLGARLADGRPHPAAGTGFVLGAYKRHPVDPSIRQGEPGCYWAVRYELVQLRYDGTRMRVADRRSMAVPDGFMEEWHFLWYGLSNAIPDGEDLLSGVTLGPVEPGSVPGNPRIPTSHPHGHPLLGRNFGSGLCRWRYGQDGWRPVAFTPVTGADMAFEPSVVRDIDGALLMAVRGKGLKEPPGAVHDGIENTFEHFRVYRSTDSGATWQRAIHLPRMRNASPVILNRTVGGRPYLAANPYVAGPDSKGRPVLSTSRRGTLALWPLADGRDGVGEAVCVLDADLRFGPPRTAVAGRLKHDNLWILDHPMGSVCRLRDGRWHALQCFRVTDAAVNFGGAGACEQAGAWVEDVRDGAETPVGAWRFE